MFTGSCEAMCQAASDLVSAAHDWPENTADLMRELGAESIFGSRTLRRVADDFDPIGIFLDFEPTIGAVDYSTAIDFVREHHEPCGGLPRWRFGAGIRNGPTLLGVVIVALSPAAALTAAAGSKSGAFAWLGRPSRRSLPGG